MLFFNEDAQKLCLSSTINEKRCKIIMAQEADCGIGYKGKLPWEKEPCKDDMLIFKLLTTGINANNAVIMGYNTWISIPEKNRPLRNRINIVMTQSHYDEMRKEKSADYVFNNWDDVKKHISSSHYDDVWIIGGVEIYRDAFSRLDIGKVYRTILKKKYQCDRYLDVYSILNMLGKTFSRNITRETDHYIMDVITINHNGL